MSLLELFCHVDDFCKAFAPHWEQELLHSGLKRRRRATQLCTSEIMTILIFFHQMRYRDFKTYYTQFVQVYLQAEFPNLVSYSRFVEQMPSMLVPLCAYLQSGYGSGSGVSFIDSTPLAVCHNRRIQRHRVFRGIAQRGKNSVDWFFGFKLHLVVTERGDRLACRLTDGNVDDRTPVPQLTRWLWGKLFGDKGYLSQPLTEQLRQRGIHLITRLKSKMKNRLILLSDKLLLRKRSIIETITDQLKNISQIEHSRHRSLPNFRVNLVCGLIAYCRQPKKPPLALDLPQLEALIPN